MLNQVLKIVTNIFDTGETTLDFAIRNGGGGGRGGRIDRYRYLMFYAQSTVKGIIRAKEKVFLSQIKIMIHNLTHIPSLRTGDIWGKRIWMSREGRN